jgi:hypothetical protein
MEPAIDLTLQTIEPAAIVETLAMPQGCAAWLTVQRASCSVAHLFTCGNDPEGYMRLITIDQGGGSFIVTVDADGQWIESNDMVTGAIERAVPEPPDPYSLNEFLTTGTDSFNFSMQDVNGTIIRYFGADVLTDRTTTIDGVELVITTGEMAGRGGGLTRWSRTSSDFFSLEWGVGFAGTSNLVFDGAEQSFDDTPVQFDMPGDPGFLTTTPLFGCGT